MTDGSIVDGGSSLGHMPEGRWVFDSTVTAVFSDMLNRSIPEYDAMRRAVFAIGSKFVRSGTYIADLGCSRGDGLASFVDAFGDANNYIGVDVSQPMLAAVRDRFADKIAQGLVSILDLDLRSSYPKAVSSLTLSILCLQFVPINYRLRVLRNAFLSTIPGGALVLVEKILGASVDLDGAMIDVYHALKETAGYSKAEIERKRVAIEGTLVPITARWNEDLLRDAGFTQVDCFWRWMNFAGWIAVK